MESWHTGHWTLRIRDTSDLKNSYRTVRTLIIYKLAYNCGHRLEVFGWLKCLNTPWHQVRGASCMVFGCKVSQVWSVPGPKWTVSDLLVADRSSRDYTRLDTSHGTTAHNSSRPAVGLDLHYNCDRGLTTYSSSLKHLRCNERQSSQHSPQLKTAQRV